MLSRILGGGLEMCEICRSSGSKEIIVQVALELRESP